MSTKSSPLRLKETIPIDAELQGISNNTNGSDIPYFPNHGVNVIRKDASRTSGSALAINDKDLTNRGSDHNETKTNANVLQEIRIILHLASQGIVSQLGWSVPSFFIAHHIGKNLSEMHLDGYSLAILTGNLCVLSLLDGVFSAADTLLPQAFGARKYSDLQLIAIRCVIVCLGIVIPFVGILLFHMKTMLIAFGEDPIVSEYAAAWYRVYCLSVPCYVVYYTTTCFLAAQYIVTPTVVVALVSSLVLLPVLVEVLGFIFGFIGTSLAVVIYQLFQAVAIISYSMWQKPHHPDSWSRSQFSLGKVMQWKPFSQLLWLSAGGMLAGSEWIYWELLSLFIGTLGVTELTVHTISSQIVTFIYMMPLGVSEAITIRLGNVLPRSPKQAKLLSFYYFIGGSCMMMFIGSGIYVSRYWIYALFTTEPDVIEGCDEIWPKVSFYIIIMGLFGMLKGIATALGKQWILGILVVVYLWSISLPLLYHLSIKKSGGLSIAWNCIWPANFGIVVTLGAYLVRLDWDPIGEEIRQSELEYEAEEEDSEMVQLTGKHKKDHESDDEGDDLTNDSSGRVINKKLVEI